MKQKLLLYVFSGHFTSAMNQHLTHSYLPVVTSCKNVYFLHNPPLGEAYYLNCNLELLDYEGMPVMMMIMMFVPVYILRGLHHIDSYKVLPNINCIELQQDFILEKFRRISLDKPPKGYKGKVIRKELWCSWSSLHQLSTVSWVEGFLYRRLTKKWKKTKQNNSLARGEKRMVVLES